jgi:hypothetical protein
MAAGDVLRLQCLRKATALSHDIVVASPHGTMLLEYVMAEMEATGQSVTRTHDNLLATTRGSQPDTVVPLVITP